MKKAIRIGKYWQLGIWWRKDWKFVGLIFMKDFGFSRRIGITFKRKQF